MLRGHFSIKPRIEILKDSVHHQEKTEQRAAQKLLALVDKEI